MIAGPVAQAEAEAMLRMAQPDTDVTDLCEELSVTRQTLYRHVAPVVSPLDHQQISAGVATMTIDANLTEGKINGHDVSFKGEAFGITAGRYGEHLVVGLRISGSGACNNLFIGITQDLQNQLAFRRLMAAAGGRRAAEAGKLIRWSIGFSAAKDEQDRRDAWIAHVAATLPTALKWASQWDGKNSNREIEPAVSNGTYGVFDTTFDLATGMYQVRCPKGKQAPLKALDAFFDYEKICWWIPDSQEAALAFLAEKQIKAKAKATKEDAKAPVEGFGTLKITNSNRGYEISFPKDFKMSGRLHESVKGAKWDREATIFLISHRSRNSLIAWVEAEQRLAEEREAQQRHQDAARAAAEAAAITEIKADPIASTPHVRIDQGGGYIGVHFGYDADAVTAIKSVPGTTFIDLTDRGRMISSKPRHWQVPVIHHTILRATIERIEVILATAEQETIRRRQQHAKDNPPRPRMVFPSAKAPPMNRPVRVNGSIVVFTEHSRSFRLDENAPSIYGHEFLGYEDAWAANYYFRPATEDETSILVAEEARVKAERDADRAREKRLSEIAARIRAEGERPAGSNHAEGEKLHDSQNIYGNGDWFVIGQDHIWYIRNNGMDGDDWSQNNIRTGGAGAIGWRIPFDQSLADDLRFGCPEN